MLEFKRGQRTFLAEKFGDLGNIAAGALAFGQALSGGRVSIALTMLGALVWIAMTLIGLGFAGGEDE